MFAEEEVCYECNCTVVDGRDYLELVTWVYLGHFKMNHSARDCDVAYHYYRFAKFEDFHRWKQKPDSKLPAVNFTSMDHVRRKFLNRQAMVDSVLDWNSYLKDNPPAT